MQQLTAKPLSSLAIRLDGRGYSVFIPDYESEACPAKSYQDALAIIAKVKSEIEKDRQDLEGINNV